MHPRTAFVVLVEILKFPVVVGERNQKQKWRDALSLWLRNSRTMPMLLLLQQEDIMRLSRSSYSADIVLVGMACYMTII